MGKLFGTDGIRAVANEGLDAPLSYRIGQAAAISLIDSGTQRPCVVIGKDTRISSDMLEAALVAGLTSCGCDVIALGVIPTPAVAYLTCRLHADAGVVISASHNPFEHNGIKMFSREGFKLSDELEAEMESLILQKEPLPVRTGAGLGRVLDGQASADLYLEHLEKTLPPLAPMRVLIDCANGAASATARRLFTRFDLDVDFLCDEPDGVNINSGCGSTHLGLLSERVVQGHYDLGIAFDGDADRCLCVDETGCEIDGDQIMAICAASLVRQGKLAGGGFVATVMSNIGLHKYCDAQGLKLLCASVGDRNVLELMQKEGMCLGGEQSGHIIFLEHMTTGDGQLAALQFLSILSQSGCKASELRARIPRYPQVLKNVRVGGNDEKTRILQSDALASAVQDAEAQLGADGRVLIRASGTEPLIRVMVEAGTQAQAETLADALSTTVESLQKIPEK